MIDLFLGAILANVPQHHPRHLRPIMGCEVEVFGVGGEEEKTCKTQPSVPLPKIEDICPFGYVDSNAYCVPRHDDVEGIIPNYSKELFKKCPPGYKNNRGYCQSTPDTGKNAIPMLTDRCPKKYYKSGNFCIQICD